jgi:hypothetical protein
MKSLFDYQQNQKYIKTDEQARVPVNTTTTSTGTFKFNTEVFKKSPEEI